MSERKMRDLLARAEEQVADEIEEHRLALLQERIRELKAAKLTVARLTDQLEKLLEEPLDRDVLDC